MCVDYAHYMDFFFWVSAIFIQSVQAEEFEWEHTAAPGTDQSTCLIVYLAPFSSSSTGDNLLQISICSTSQAVKEQVKLLSFSCCYLKKEEKYASHACKWDRRLSVGECAVSTACILTSGMQNSLGGN